MTGEINGYDPATEALLEKTAAEVKLHGNTIAAIDADAAEHAAAHEATAALYAEDVAEVTNLVMRGGSVEFVQY